MVLLPENVTTMMIADVSRQAILSLVSGTGAGWGKRELAQWLAGPYRLLTSYAQGIHAVTEPRASSVPPSLTPLPLAKVNDLLGAAKEELLATLLMAAPPDSDVSFADAAIVKGHLVRTRDRQSRGGWAPVDARGMLLADRLLSLVAVDYLMRPADYLALLSVCGRCQAVSFDAQVRVRGHCPTHRRSSRKIRVSR